MTVKPPNINGFTSNYVVQNSTVNIYTITGTSLPLNPTVIWSPNGCGTISNAVVANSSATEIDGTFSYTPPPAPPPPPPAGAPSSGPLTELTSGQISVTINGSTFGPWPCVYPSTPAPPTGKPSSGTEARR